jgi:hypothetical protein
MSPAFSGDFENNTPKFASDQAQTLNTRNCDFRALENNASQNTVRDPDN